MLASPWRSLYILLLVLFSCLSLGNSLQVDGIWSPSVSSLKVIARFAVGKSNPNHHEDTDGYVFGNLTTISHLNTNKSDSGRNLDNPYGNAVMLYINRTLFKQVYNMHLEETKNRHSSFCKRVYELVHNQFYDSKCSLGNRSTTAAASTDFVRYMPCPKDKPCNEPSRVPVLPNYQFTYVVDNPKEPTFWFLVLLACQRKISQDVHTNSSQSKCTWTASANTKSVISYSIWLVNGHPNSATNKLIDLDYQFSVEQTNLFVYIILNFSYLILLFVQLYALSKQKNRSLNYLFTISLALHCLAYFFICCHKIVFAHNGKGFETLNTVADIIKIMSTALFILFVLMIAKGWPISKLEMFSKTMLLTIWAAYTLIKILLYIWVKDSLNYIEEVDEYHTWPGWISLGFRMLLMFWFLHELRHTMILEQDPRKLKFYLHFGAGILVWFIHLVLVAMVCIQIDLLWRYKIITGFSAAADIFAYAIVTRLMLQTRHNLFLSHESDIDFNDDLDYYDDHSTNSETYTFTKANYRTGKHSYDNDISCDINAIKS